jgi:hypothetical protein
MQSPFDFIVTGQRYNNTKEVGGIELIVNTSEEDHRFSNRYAEVVEVPRGYTGPVQKGDTLLVHHNVFKFYNDIKGRRKSSRSFFRDDIFFVEPNQFYLYRHDGKWHTYDRYCFVKPMPAVDSYIKKPFTNEPLMGVMRYPNAYLLTQGVKEGDTVCFKPDSEYEFDVDGEKLYRIFDHQITMKL